jgi:hypothetical protein
MPQKSLDDLLAKLEKGYLKTRGYFDLLSYEEWQSTVYGEPNWSAYNLMAHFISAEEHLLELAQNVAGNGPGAPEGFELDEFNAQEQNRFQGFSIQALLDALEKARQRTIEWARSLTDEQLEKKGRHPALGQISVEDMLTAVYGHQILHMRDLVRFHREKKEST